MVGTTATETAPDRCNCTNPTPGTDEATDRCADCGGLILRPIVGGEVHAGYTALGNGQAWFDSIERDLSIRPHSGGSNTKGDADYYRQFGDMTVVPPVESDDAENIGAVALSIDTVILPDGEVEVLIDNRLAEDLPDGAAYSFQTDHGGASSE